MNKRIGIVVKNLKYQFFATIAASSKEYANNKGYSTTILEIDDSHGDTKNLTRIISSKNIRGLIVSQVLDEQSEIGYLFKMKMTKYPFVLLEDFKGVQANIVTLDNKNAIKEAVKYLINTGHTKIVYFSGPPCSLHNIERIEGFKYAFSESTLVFNNKMIVPIGDSFNESYEKTIDFFKKMSRKSYPTAIVCSNDYQALAVMNALMKLNIRVPDDVSLIGFNDIYDEKVYPVPLTTIKAPLNDMGIKAAEILIRNIESDTDLPKEKLIFSTEFILRESTRNMIQTEKVNFPSFYSKNQ